MRDDRRRPELRPLDQTRPFQVLFPPPSYRLPPPDDTTRHNDLLTSQTQTKPLNHSWIFARISESRNRWYSYSGAHKSAHSPQHPAKQRGRKCTHILAHFDRVPAPPREEDAVAGLHRRRDDLALLIRRAGAHSDHRRLRQRRARRRRRQEDARRGFLEFKIGMSLLRAEKEEGTYSLRLEALDEDTVKEGHNGPNGLERRLDRLHTTNVSSFLHPSFQIRFESSPFS